MKEGKRINNVLKEVLNSFWYDNLEKVIVNLHDYEYFFFDEDKFYPDIKNRFNAINNINFENDFQVVIFGQDPYPRKESATGYAFWDGKIKSWEDKLSPSFRNIIKSLLINKKLADEKTRINELRKIIKENNIPSPDDFFKNTIKNGVVWLNASFTHESKETKVLNKHLKFWSPVIRKIIDVLIEENKKKNNKIIFVFWGSKSLKLKNYILKNHGEDNFKTYFLIENKHPMNESFHQKNSFEEIEKIIKREGSSFYPFELS